MSKGGRLGEVQLGRVVVGQVVVGAAGQRVEVRQVLEAGQLTTDPALSHRSLAHQSGQLLHAGRPLLAGQVRQARGCGQQALVDLVADAGR